MRFLVAFVALATLAAAKPRQHTPVHADSVHAKAGTPIENQYIVVFKNHVDESAVLAHENWLMTTMQVASALVVQDDDGMVMGGGDDVSSAIFPDFNILRRYFLDGFKGYTARLPAKLAQALTRLPEVDYIEQDQIMTIMESQVSPPSWGLKRIGSRSLPLPKEYLFPDSAGEGVNAYVVDTGVFITHPDFEGRAVIGKSFSTDKNDRDGNGHGTHVAGTIGGITYGVAKKAKIIAVKVLNAQGSGTNSDVIAGIDWVGKNHKKGDKSVANMSLGGQASAALDAALKAAIKAGVMFAVAAGNSAGDSCKLSPARVPEALTVAASDKTDKYASFSEHGKCVNIIAPGVDITSSWNNGKENTISGTSMATPHACGVLALAAAEHDFETPKELKDYVIAMGTRGAIKGVPNRQTVNIFLYANVTGPAPEPGPGEPDEPEDPEPEDPEPPEEGVCPFPQCLFDPACTSCCFEGVDC
ncbi:hypothetical protein HK101_004748 [Irineochytrium annulatum]|nr:hypothetical protein HK101_004748 [Irineochytrium annulatum]